MYFWTRDYYIKVYRVVPVYSMKACRGNRGITPLILCLGSNWEVSGQLYPRASNHQWPLNRRLDGS
jgi:hypothetical protein